MTMETINGVLFPPFLFTTLFCLASAFLHEPEAANLEELKNNLPEGNLSTDVPQSSEAGSEVNEAIIEIENPASIRHFRHRGTSKQTPGEPATLIDFAARSDSSQTLISAVNPSLISLRQARKIASAIKAAAPELGFKQKVNGADSSLEWLQAQIKNRLESSPDVVMPIILKLAPQSLKSDASYERSSAFGVLTANK